MMQQEGRLGEMISFVADRFELDPKYLRAVLGKEFPGIYDKKRCPNCDALMKKYIFRLSYLDGTLLSAMANEVREKTRKGVDFTEANKTHVPSLLVSNSVHDRTTIASKLGLVAKYKENGRQKQGVWVITKRGWEALRGDPVPSEVVVSRGNI